MRATAVLLLLAVLAPVPVAAQSPNDAVALATFHASRAGLACAACHPEGDSARGGNRLGGNAMTALFTFGPIAGREAAARALG
jgi:succinate dehydrogenase/fumarate reductase flavoprotein subunit